MIFLEQLREIDKINSMTKKQLLKQVEEQIEAQNKEIEKLKKYQAEDLIETNKKIKAIINYLKCELVEDACLEEMKYPFFTAHNAVKCYKLEKIKKV